MKRGIFSKFTWKLLTNFIFDPLIEGWTCLWYAWCLMYLPPKSSQSGFPPTQPDTVQCPDPDAVLTIWAVGAPLCIHRVASFAKTMMFSSFLLFSFVFVISADSIEGESFFSPTYEHKKRLLVFSVSSINPGEKLNGWLLTNSFCFLPYPQCLSWEGSWCCPGHVSALIN